MRNNDLNKAWKNIIVRLEKSGKGSAYRIRIIRDNLLNTVENILAEAKLKNRVEKFLYEWLPSYAKKEVVDFSEKVVTEIRNLLIDKAPARKRKSKKVSKARSK